MAFIGIKIPSIICNSLKTIDVPGEKIDTSDMHITIVCFDDNMKIKDVLKAAENIYKASKNTDSFKIKLNKVSCFPVNPTGKSPIIIPIVSEDLQKIHKKIKTSFNKNKVDYNNTFKVYKPHITLSYNNNEIKNFDIDPIEFEVNELVLFGGDNGLNMNDIRIVFPLHKYNKTSDLEFKSEVFYKLASVL